MILLGNLFNIWCVSSVSLFFECLFNRNGNDNLDPKLVKLLGFLHKLIGARRHEEELNLEMKWFEQLDKLVLAIKGCYLKHRLEHL